MKYGATMPIFRLLTQNIPGDPVLGAGQAVVAGLPGSRKLVSNH